MNGCILSGRVILDGDSRKKLKSELREEIINEIEQSGFHNYERRQIIENGISWKEFYEIIYECIDDMVKEVKDSPIIYRRDDLKKYEKLKLIQSIINFDENKDEE